MTLVVAAAALTWAGTAAADDALTAKARELLDEARRARMESRWEQCVASATAAWALVEHPVIAATLGDCAFELGRYRDAATFLDRYLAAPPEDASQEAIDFARAQLHKARAHVAAIRVELNVAGTQLSVDGEPIADPPSVLYLDPGRHRLEARREGYHPTHRDIDARAGRSETIVLDLAPESRPPSAGAPDSVHPMPAIYLTGYGVGGAMGIAAIALGVVGANKGSDASELEDALTAQHGERPCAASDPRCAEVAELWRAHRNLVNPAIWMGAGAGVVLVGTMIYHLGSGEDASDFAVIPMAAPDGGGMTASWRW